MEGVSLRSKPASLKASGIGENMVSLRRPPLHLFTVSLVASVELPIGSTASCDDVHVYLLKILFQA